MGIYIDHGIEIRNANGEIVVPSKTLDPILAKSAIYIQNKESWFETNNWSTTIPIDKSLIADINIAHFNIANCDQCSFYHVFRTISTL